MLFDYDLELLKDIVAPIDHYLEAIIQKSREVDDPDSLGYFDRAEHIIGLGFVACQTYIITLCGYLRVRKQDAFSFGPKHQSGQTVVQIANHAANYWKHNGERIMEKNEKQRKYVEKAFAALGFPVGTDYPLSGILAEITHPQPVKFVSLIGLLTDWKDELLKESRP